MSPLSATPPVDAQWASWEEYIKLNYGVMPAVGWPDALDAVGTVADMIYNKATETGAWTNIVLSDGRTITEEGFDAWLDQVVPAFMDKAQNDFYSAKTVEDYTEWLERYQKVQCLCAYHEPDVMELKRAGMRKQLHTRYLELLLKMEMDSFNGTSELFRTTCANHFNQKKTDRCRTVSWAHYDDFVCFFVVGRAIQNVFGEDSAWRSFAHHSNTQRLAPQAYSGEILTKLFDHNGRKMDQWFEDLESAIRLASEAHLVMDTPEKPGLLADTINDMQKYFEGIIARRMGPRLGKAEMERIEFIYEQVWPRPAA